VLQRSPRMTHLRSPEVDHPENTITSPLLLLAIVNEVPKRLRPRPHEGDQGRRLPELV
jgi:hypothetical protein